MNEPDYPQAASGSAGTNQADRIVPSLVLEVGGREVYVPERDARNPRRIEHAYAISTHKSQGSQFGTVMIPVTPSQIMDRTMLYTALTRAREKVVLVGSRAVFAQAVIDPPSHSARRTGMADALMVAAEEVRTGRRAEASGQPQEEV